VLIDQEQGVVDGNKHKTGNGALAMRNKEKLAGCYNWPLTIHFHIFTFANFLIP